MTFCHHVTFYNIGHGMNVHAGADRVIGNVRAVPNVWPGL